MAEERLKSLETAQAKIEKLEEEKKTLKTQNFTITKRNEFLEEEVETMEKMLEEAKTMAEYVQVNSFKLQTVLKNVKCFKISVFFINLE